MEQPIHKFQNLLRDIFQFDCADLDFGIYRIMNHKRAVIEKFISTDLPKAIADELSRGGLAEQSQAAQELESVRQQVRESLGTYAINGDGKLDEAYHATPLGKRYLTLTEKAAGGRGREALEATIFNHLYAFFSRYYQDGDFISKRRYSKRQRYAIPYNGEEVHLHWANHDQYYIKTAEYFQDYSFASRGVTVHFKLKAANVEQNNVKGEARFFIPRPKEIVWDAEAHQLVIPFEFRPLTEQETVSYGTKNQQDKINAEAAEAIPMRLSPKDHLDALAVLTAERRKTGDGAPVSFLEHHLRQYTRRNTSDFFIHKDLKGFLSGELDFYLKNEVLNLDEMETAGEDRSEGWFQVMRVIKAVGGRIIEFLDQIESFQKMLWEKRKFITETQYCITVGTIDERFYPDIAACDAQWAEWKDLFHIDEEKTDLFTNGKNRKDRRIAFLKAHPTLVVDTKHLLPSFTDSLLETLTAVDDIVDGVLVHSENWQALNFMRERWQQQVQCIYIDPPYNTDAGPILYKNGYRNSSWVSMIQNRLAASSSYMTDEGILCVTIDDYQVHELAFVLDKHFGRPNQLGVAVIRNNPSGRSTVRGLSVCHEYAFFYRIGSDASLAALPRTEKQLQRFSVQDGVSVNWRNFRKDGGAVTHRAARPKQYYPIYVNAAARTLRIPAMAWNKHKRAWDLEEEPRTDEVVVWPIDDKGKERVWSLNSFSAREHMMDLEVRVGKDGTPGVFRRHTPSDGVLPRSWWDKKEYAAREHGSAALAKLFGESSAFTFAKSPHAVQDCLWVSGLDLASDGTVFDFFAGSGTTVHAVINLNRQDGGERRFLAVELENYFDTVLLPRIKKVIFTPEWKDGKPKRMATPEETERSPRIVKYIRLESYEDALNNIAFDDASAQATLKFEDYLLRYMLRWETRKSETLLNVEKLARPFTYKLTLTKDGESVDRAVDVPETFNYLLGLHVMTRKVYDDDGRRYLAYRGTIDHRQVAVIWRETDGWQKKDLERDKKFVADQKLTDGADEVFVNGDSFIPNARALEPVFKARMFSTVEA
jgi:adenine-specific DNA-methyltransferase